jgi:chromosome segregation ATPase
MKIILDLILVAALVWLGWLWNGEKQKGLALSDEVNKLKGNVAQLELDLAQAKDFGEKTQADFINMRDMLAVSDRNLKDQTDALAAKTTEADELRSAAAALKARVQELEGYKAKAIVAEMPKPAAPAAP